MASPMLRSRLRQVDVLEFCQQQHSVLMALRKERYLLQKGFVAYGRDIAEFVREMRDKSPKPEDDKEAKDRSARALQQHYQSQELLKKMKWKRLSWDENADYDGFAQRIMENDSMFSKCPAFSFMSLYVARDPSTQVIGTPVAHKTKIESGDMTNWLIQERTAEDVSLYALNQSLGVRRAAFTVDWTSGEARILDTASAQEILTFLATIAPRLQSLQVKMEEQQTKLVADVDNVRVRLGLSKVTFNTNDVSFWDDPKRSSDPNYVNPDELRMCLDGLLKSALLFRWYFKGQQIRIVKAGKPYNVNVATKEVEIPANFADFSWVGRHTRWQGIERLLNFCRTFWWVWFSLALVVVGDVELI